MREKESARQQVTFYHRAKHIGLHQKDIAWLLEDFKERSDMFMLHFRNETLMAVGKIVRKSGQPISHERERKMVVSTGDTPDGGLKILPTACVW